MARRIEATATPLGGLQLLERRPIRDDRGFFERVFCADELADALNGRTIAQINRTHTVRRGVVRGMHFQLAPHREIKVISCLRGAIFDVAVDLRPDSSTYLRWHAEVLSAENHRSLLVPEGFAHGFQTLTEDCELLYLHTCAFHPDSERGLNPNDPKLAIAWPEPVTAMSPRDAAFAMLTDDFVGAPA